MRIPVITQDPVKVSQDVKPTFRYRRFQTYGGIGSTFQTFVVPLYVTWQLQTAYVQVTGLTVGDEIGILLELLSPDTGVQVRPCWIYDFVASAANMPANNTLSFSIMPGVNYPDIPLKPGDRFAFSLTTGGAGGLVVNMAFTEVPL